MSSVVVKVVVDLMVVVVEVGAEVVVVVGALIGRLVANRGLDGLNLFFFLYCSILSLNDKGFFVVGSRDCTVGALLVTGDCDALVNDERDE